MSGGRHPRMGAVLTAAPTEPWTPADLSGTDWEWYDYNQPSKVTLGAGSVIQRVETLRPGSGNFLEMPLGANQGSYQSPGAEPGAMVCQRNQVKGLWSPPINSGTISAYVIVLWSLTEPTPPTSPAIVHCYQCGNQYNTFTPGDVGYGSLAFYSSYASPEWLTDGMRQNGTLNSGTPTVANPPVPWVNIWGLAIPTVTLSQPPRRIFINLERGSSENSVTAGGSVNANAKMYEQVIWKTAPPSLSDIEKVEGYMAWKSANAAFGLVAKLPAGHPYKNAAPTK